MRRNLVRNVVAWLVVLGVYAQLAAAAVCAAGAPMDGGGFPICHAQAQPGDGHSDDRVPSPPDNHCPFCAAHCHAPATLSPAPEDLVRVEIASVAPERPAFVVHTTPCVVAGASPRGPPVAA